MNLGQEINVNEIPESTGFDPLPAGWYQASVKKAELKSGTKEGASWTGMSLEYDILGPTGQGRKAWGFCGVSSSDPEKEGTSRYFLGKLMRAAGLSKLTDTDQLIGCNLEIKLKIKKSEEYGDKNEVNDYRSMSGSSMPSVPVPGGEEKPPWAK